MQRQSICRNALGPFLISALVALGGMGVLTGCQLKIQDSGDSQEPLKLSTPTVSCFDSSLKSIEGYFKGEAKAQEIDSAFVCISDALDMFATYGRGSAQKDSFSNTELKSFLERYFLGDLKLSNAMIAEIMRVKQALLGGGTERLTRGELNRLIELLNVLRREAVRLQPYINILNMNIEATDPTLDLSLLEQGLSDFTFSMDTLGALLGQSREPYKFENFKQLLIEIQGLYKGRSTWTGPDWFSKQMPIIKGAKALLIRPGGDAIAPDEWQLFFSHVGRVYSLYLRFRYGISGRDTFRGEVINQVETGVIEVCDILSEAIDAKGTGRIEYSIFNDLLDAMNVEDGLLSPLRTETLKALMPVMFEKVLNPIVVQTSRTAKPLDPTDPKSAKGYRPVQNGMTKDNLYRLKDAILGWLEMQHLWERVEREAVQAYPELAGQPIPMKVVREFWSTYSANHEETWSDLNSLFNRPVPTSTRTNGVLIFEPSKKLYMDHHSFSTLNWKQQIVRTIGYGYISDPDGLRMTGITSEQMENVFKDFQELAIDLKFLDRSETDIWKTGFSVANIFLFSSNGDERLGFHEAVDLFVFAFSSSSIAKKVREQVDLNCEPGELDPAGLPRIKADCWRTQFRKGYNTFFADIPGWTNQMKGFDDKGWNAFFGHMEQAARKAINPDGPLMSSEMDRVVSIHHYIEALFTRWDSNQDGYLNLRETEKAYFVFRGLLKRASGFKKESELHALYAFLCVYGRPPNDKDIGDILKWLWFKSNPQIWETRVHADRAKIGRIFGALAAEF